MKVIGIIILKQLLITFSIDVVIALVCLVQSSSITGSSIKFQNHVSNNPPFSCRKLYFVPSGSLNALRVEKSRGH